MNKKEVLIVAGPTGTGKTRFAVELAKKYNGELISADSRQVYKHLDITTNKGDATLIRNYLSESQAGKLRIMNEHTGDGRWEMGVRELPLHTLQGVPIHLLSFLDLRESFSVFDFKNLALALIRNIQSRGKMAILVGGTGLYIDALVKNYLPVGQTGMQELGDREFLNELSLEELQAKLFALSPKRLADLNNSDRNNKRRLIRLIEKSDRLSVIGDQELGGERLDPGVRMPNTKHETLTFKMYYPKYDWNELKIKLAQRVDQMFEDGIVDEVKMILQDESEDSPGLQIMGAREVVKFLKNEITLEECKEKILIAHRQYAKRQRTWFEGKGRGYELLVTNY